VYRRPVVHQPGQLKEQLQGSPDEPRHSTHQCDPLIYAKTLAAPGLCFWCLSDKSLPPTCVCSSSSLEPRGSLISRSPSWSQLAARFTPVLTHGAQIHSTDRGHLQDVHCWIPRDLTTPKAGVKHSRSEGEEGQRKVEEGPRNQDEGLLFGT